MGNQKMTKNEIDIEIKDLLWELLRRWRLIVVLALCCGIGLTAYQYRIDMNKKDVVTVKKSQEELEKAMGTQDLDEVTAAVALKRQIDEKSAYMEASELMHINPYAENVIVLQYYVNAELEAVASDVAEACVAYVENGHLAQDIIDSSADEQGVMYVAELLSIVKEEGNVYINAKDTKESVNLSLHGTDVSHSFDIKVVGTTAERAESLAVGVKAAVQEYSMFIEPTIGEHHVQLVKETASVIVDQELAELQTGNATGIKNISNNLDSMKNEMTGDQISLYVYRTTVTEPTTSGTVAATEKIVTISFKHMLIGIFVGVILACALIFALYLFAVALRNSEEVKTLYNVKVLGRINDSEFEKKKLFGVVDALVVKLQNIGKKTLTYEQELQMICANIALDCHKNNRSEVVFSSSVEEKLSQEILRAIVEKCGEKGICVTMVNAINYDAEALETLAKVGSVVFIEKKRVSLYDELYKEITICKENDINVLGMVVLGV